MKKSIHLSKCFRMLVFFLPLLLLAFSADNSGSVYNFYDFQNLKQAASPVYRKVIKIENLSQKNKGIENGYLITYKNLYAESVKISGDFSKWDSIPMIRSRFGIWYYFIGNYNKQEIIRYKLNVDKIWLPDPLNTDRQDDGMGSYLSVLRFGSAPENHLITYKVIEPALIEFRIFNSQAEYIAIVGDFNRWNPENDKLIKNENDIWSLKKRLTPGLYRYMYIIDGKWTADLYNENTAVDDTGAICSLIKIDR